MENLRVKMTKKLKNKNKKWKLNCMRPQIDLVYMIYEICNAFID